MEYASTPGFCAGTPADPPSTFHIPSVTSPPSERSCFTPEQFMEQARELEHRAKRLFEEERREIQRGLESCIFSTDTFATPFKAAAEQQQASAGAAAAAPPRPSGAARYDRAAGGASGAHCDDGATAVPRPQQQQVMPFGSPPHTSSSSSWLNADPHHFHQALQPFMHHADLMLASELFPDVIPPSALALGAAAAKLQQQHHTPMAPDAPVAYHQQTALTQQHASGRQL